jgi:hypothetical protein
MILPDINLLVYAVDANSPFHPKARRWWEEVLSSDQPVGLCYPSILGFIRLTTNRHVFRSPLGVRQALGIAESWLAQPNTRLLSPTGRHWNLLSDLLQSSAGSANLTTDADMAAYAIEHGCTLFSNDSDFGRFEELRWKNPLA